MGSFRKRQSVTMPCRRCSDDVENVAEDAVSVLCWKCVVDTCWYAQVPESDNEYEDELVEDDE